MSLVLAVLCSGAASLAYQVAWTRQLTTLTSAAIIAQTVVLAVFMAGLGLGSLISARFAPRSRAPLIGYAAVEFIALGIAVVSPAIIGHAPAIQTSLHRAGLSLETALWLELTLLSAFLLIPTSFLGASLPFVIEYWERRKDITSRQRGRVVSAVYGFNTLGAGLGVIASGFFTIEQFGLSKTVWLGAAAAFLAVAIALARHLTAPVLGGPKAELDHGRTKLPKRIMLAVFVGGGIGLAVEVLWSRLFSLLLPNTVYAFSQVLLAVLIGIAIGSLIAGAITRRAPPELEAPLYAQRAAGLLAALGAILIAAQPLFLVQLAGAEQTWNSAAAGLSIASTPLLIAMLVPPSALIAALLPLLVVASRASKGSKAFGLLYATNTAGGVLGSAVMGFWLIPRLGTPAANAMLVLAALGVSALLLLGVLPRRRFIGVLAPSVLGAGMMLVSHDVPRQLYELKLDPELEVLEFREGRSSTVMVTRHKEIGQRRLWLNSSWVAGTGGTHHALGQLPVLFQRQPRRILGIALGTGQTFASALSHGAERLDCVEIDDGVIELSRRWFSEFNRGLLDHPKVTVHNEDGRSFLRSTENEYEVIVLEPLQAWSAGTSGLYSIEFYREAARVLKSGGVVAQWIPFYGQGVDETKSMVLAGLEVFDHGSLWLDGHDGILLLSDEDHRLSLDEIDRRLLERGVQRQVAQADVDDAASLATLFLMDDAALRRWTAGAARLVDDHPFLEFKAARAFGRSSFPKILASARAYASKPLDFFGHSSTASAAELVVAEKARDSIIEANFHRGNTPEIIRALEAGLPEAAESKPWLANYRNAIVTLATSPELQARGPAAVEAIYRRAIENAPRLGEARLNLAVHYAKTGRPELAREVAEDALSDPRVRERAERLLERLEQAERKP